MLLFKDDNFRDELAFARSLSAQQRKIVHLVARKLGLDHSSVGEGDDRHVVVFKSAAGGGGGGGKVCGFFLWGFGRLADVVLGDSR